MMGWPKGKSPSIEHKRKLSKAFKGRFAGSKSPMWKGGRYKAHGYIFIWTSDHPFRDSHNYVPEHRLIVEKYLRRYLKPKERVHHINKIKSDNRIENLMVFKSKGYHLVFHRFGHCNPKGIIFDGRNYEKVGSKN